MESRLPFSCFPWVPRQRCIGERAEAGGTRFSASISAAGRCLSLSFWTSMNYSTQDTVSPYREKVTLQFLPACPTCEDTSRTATKRKRKTKQRKKKDKKNHQNHMQAGVHASNQKKRLTSGHLREAKAGKSIDCCWLLSVAYQSILLTWLLGHHLLPMLKSAEWSGNGWSPMSLLAFLFADRVPCIVVVVVVVVAKPVSQPSSGGMDGWMDLYLLPRLACAGWVLRCAVLCCAGLVPTRILPTRLSEHVAAAPLYM